MAADATEYQHHTFGFGTANPIQLPYLVYSIKLQDSTSLEVMGE